MKRTIKIFCSLGAIIVFFFLFLNGANDARATIAPIYWIPESGSCSIPEYKSEVACTQIKGEWVETVNEYCSKTYNTSENWSTRAACEAPANTYHPEVYHPGYCSTWTSSNNGDDEKTCKAYFHEWHPAWTENATCTGPTWPSQYSPLNREDCESTKRGYWHDTAWEHCADGTTKNKDQCLAVGTWTKVAGRCTDNVSSDIASCNAAAQAQEANGVLDTGNFCRVTGGVKRCSELNFSWSPSHNYTSRVYTTNNGASYGRYWPSTSVVTAPGNTYCVDNKCTDVPNPSFALVKETSYNDTGKLVTFQVKGRTKDFLYYPVAEGLGWDSVKTLDRCECDSDSSWKNCGLNPFVTEGTTNPNDCYDEYTVVETQSRSIEVTRYGISKATTYTLPVEAGCPSPLPVGGGLYACASWKFDRLESSPRGTQCSCDSTSTALDCKLVFTGNYTPNASECYDTTRDYETTQPGLGQRYVRLKKVKRFQFEPFRATPISSDEMSAANSRCFGAFTNATVEEKTSEITEYTIPVYNYTRAVSAASRAEPNDSVTCRVKLTSQYGRNVDQNGKGYAGEIFQTTNFIKAPTVDFFTGSTNTAAPGATVKAIKVYRKNHATVTLSWSVSAAEKVRLTGDDLPGGWQDWYNGKPILNGETSVSNLSYGLHTYTLVAMNSRGDTSPGSTITIDVIDPPLRITTFTSDTTKLKNKVYDPNGEDTIAFTFVVEGADKVEFYCHSGWLAWKKCDPGGGFLGLTFADKPIIFESTNGDDIAKTIVIPGADIDDTYAKLVACRAGQCLEPRELVIKQVTQGRIIWCSIRSAGTTIGIAVGACIVGALVGSVVPGPGTIAGCFIAAGGLTAGGTATAGGIAEGISMCVYDPDSFFVSFGGTFGPGVSPGSSSKGFVLGGTQEGTVGGSSGGTSGGGTGTVIGSGGQSTGSIGDTSALDVAGRQSWRMSDLPPSIRDSGLQWPLPDMSPVREPIKRVIHENKDRFLPGGDLRPRDPLPVEVVNKAPPEASAGLSPSLQLPGNLQSGLSILKPTEKDPTKLSVSQQGGLSTDKPSAPPAKNAKNKPSGGSKGTGKGAPPKKDSSAAQVPPATIVSDDISPSPIDGESIQVEPVEPPQKRYFVESEIPAGFEIWDAPPSNYQAMVQQGIVLEGAAKLSDGTPLGRFDGWEINRWYSNSDTGVVGARAYAPTGRTSSHLGPKEFEAYAGTFHVLFLTNGKVILIPQGKVEVIILNRP